MYLIFLGPPGSGKGTQAASLCKTYPIAHISTGDMLREEIKCASGLGKQVVVKMKQGEFIEDAVIVQLVVTRIQRPDCARGFILDGVPRTLGQAQALTQRKVHTGHIVEFFCDTEILVARLVSRRVHPASGRIYNLLTNPPLHAGKDDITGDALVQREDDHEVTARTRIQDYYDKTNEVCDYYRRLADDQFHYHRIDAAAAAPKITQQLSKILAA